VNLFPDAKCRLTLFQNVQKLQDEKCQERNAIFLVFHEKEKIGEIHVLEEAVKQQNWLAITNFLTTFDVDQEFATLLLQFIRPKFDLKHELSQQKSVADSKFNRLFIAGLLTAVICFFASVMFFFFWIKCFLFLCQFMLFFFLPRTPKHIEQRETKLQNF
jgi:hypothetical protein